MRRLPALHVIVRPLVAVLCAAALLQAMRPAVYSTRVGVQMVRAAGQQDPTQQYREQLEYLSREMHRQVPAGTRVVIVEQTPELRLRLTEFATLWGIEVVPPDGRPDVEVYLRADPAAAHGVHLLTRKPTA